MPQLKLYSGTKNASSWAMRAWLALREVGLDFDEEVVDIRRPQRFANLARIGAFSPPAAVPVLEVDGTIIFDSLAIMEYASDVSGGRLLPADPVQRARTRAVLAWQHAGLSAICARISFESSFYPCKRALTPDEIAEGGRLFAWLETLLGESGGPFLFGTVFLADFALAPAVVRLTRHAFPFDRFPKSQAWTAAVLDHHHVREWLKDADQLPHIWFDDYLVPGTPFAA